MDETKEISISRQTPLIFPFTKNSISIQSTNINNFTLIPPSPQTFHLWSPQAEPLTEMQFKWLSDKLDKLIKLDHSSKLKTETEQENNKENVKQIKKVKNSKISLSDKLQILQYTRDNPDQSRRFIASLFGVSISVVKRIWNSQNDESKLVDKRTNYRSNLTDEMRNEIEWIWQNPDPTLTIKERIKMLNNHYGWNLKPNQVYHYMKSLKNSYRQDWVTPNSQNINAVKRQSLAAKFIELIDEGREIINIGEFVIEYDERNYGRSNICSKCLACEPSIKKSYIIILAVSSKNGIIAWRVIEDNSDAKKFNHFIINLANHLFERDQCFRNNSVFLFDSSKIDVLTENSEFYGKSGLNVVFNAPDTPQFAFAERIIGEMKLNIKIKEEILLENLRNSFNKVCEEIIMDKMIRDILEIYCSKALKMEDLGDDKNMFLSFRNK